MNLIVGWEQPAFLHQSGPAIPALTVDNQCSPLYIQRLLKAKGPKRQGNGVRIPRSSGHPFHEHLTTDSTVIRPPI
ncbi:hypothetical protein N0387_31900, partial [Pseudomonas aeruginosa]|nr:hypothetical protein [Pseudomonas aeruginosa]MCS7853040.1 hypothetical protein [Pseudomonas aeruginosa]